MEERIQKQITKSFKVVVKINKRTILFDGRFFFLLCSVGKWGIEGKKLKMKKINGVNYLCSTWIEWHEFQWHEPIAIHSIYSFCMFFFIFFDGQQNPSSNSLYFQLLATLLIPPIDIDIRTIQMNKKYIEPTSWFRHI